MRKEVEKRQLGKGEISHHISLSPRHPTLFSASPRLRGELKSKNLRVFFVVARCGARVHIAHAVSATRNIGGVGIAAMQKPVVQ